MKHVFGLIVFAFLFGCGGDDEGGSNNNSIENTGSVEPSSGDSSETGDVMDSGGGIEQVGVTNVTGSGIDISTMPDTKIDEGNYAVILATTLRLLRGEDLFRLANEILEVRRSIFTPTAGFQELNITGSNGRSVYTCPGGGRVEATLDDAELSTFYYSFEECGFNATTYDGNFSVVRETEPVDGFQTTEIEVRFSSPFAFRRPSGQLVNVFGDVAQVATTTGNGERRIGEYDGFRYLNRTSDEERTNFFFDYGGGSGVSNSPDLPLDTPSGDNTIQKYNRVSFSGGKYDSPSFRVSSTLTASAVNGDFSLGQINIVACHNSTSCDPSELIMTPDNGDPSSFDVVIENGPVTQSFTVPWSDEYRRGAESILVF